MRWLALIVGLLPIPALSVAIDAIDCDAASGSYVTFSDVGHVRTQVGTDYAYGLFFNMQTTNADYILFSWKRQSNDADNWTIYFKDSTDGLCITYAFGTEACSSALSVSTWYLGAARLDETADEICLDVYTNGGTLVDSDCFTPTTSAADDSATQDTALCGVEVAGVIGSEADALVTLPFKVFGALLDTTDIQDYATDPLNTQNAWFSLYGAALHFAFDHNRLDIGVGSETITPVGTAAWGTGNGPDVPVEATGSVLMMSRFREGR